MLRHGWRAESEPSSNDKVSETEGSAEGFKVFLNGLKINVTLHIDDPSSFMERKFTFLANCHESWQARNVYLHRRTKVKTSSSTFSFVKSKKKKTSETEWTIVWMDYEVIEIENRFGSLVWRRCVLIPYYDKITRVSLSINVLRTSRKILQAPCYHRMSLSSSTEIRGFCFVATGKNAWNRNCNSSKSSKWRQHCCIQSCHINSHFSFSASFLWQFYGFHLSQKILFLFISLQLTSIQKSLLEDCSSLDNSLNKLCRCNCSTLSSVTAIRETICCS